MTDHLAKRPMARPASPADLPAKTERSIEIKQSADESDGEGLARNLLEPQIRHGATASAFASAVLTNSVEKPDIADYIPVFEKQIEKAASGNLTMASQLLASQAITLDSMFTELGRRAAMNLGEYPQAAERYAKLAFKAQTNCRTTLEALAKMHQPREQTVRHVQVSEGGQAVIADEFHHHAKGASEK